MKEYKYKEPEGKLYKVSVTKWNKYFGTRGRRPFIKVFIWVNDGYAEAHYYYTIWAKLCVTFLYPLLVICDGYKDANREVYRTWNNKKSGSFSSDYIRKIINGKTSDEWRKLEILLGKKL